MDRQNKYQIHIPLPPKIDPSVTMMTVEEKPDVTYADVGGAKEQIQKIREVVELPMLNVLSCLLETPHLTPRTFRSCQLLLLITILFSTQTHPIQLLNLVATHLTAAPSSTLLNSPLSLL